MPSKQQISSSMEDYLEIIAVLQEDTGVARVRDISERLNVKKPSVTSAMATLVKNGFVVHERYGYVDLTEKGKRIAGEVKKRHDTLIYFLNQILRIDLKTAEKDACKIEHALSTETFKKLTKFIEKTDRKK